MEFKLIGADCSNGMKIIKNLYKVEREVEVPINIEKISANEKEKYGIKVIPTLIFDDQVLASGNVISDRELKNFIKQTLEA
ncbi:MAG: thioredoxin family protein [Erysipelotrichaceae bacterium]|nr:thioredoxin family protein [Erysipelotrichaceae bacterium]